MSDPVVQVDRLGLEDEQVVLARCEAAGRRTRSTLPSRSGGATADRQRGRRPSGRARRRRSARSSPARAPAANAPTAPVPRRTAPRRLPHQESTIAATIPQPPDHLTAMAAPNATPAAYRHGRQRGEGTRRAVVVVGTAGGTRGVLAGRSIADRAPGTGSRRRPRAGGGCPAVPGATARRSDVPGRAAVLRRTSRAARPNSSCAISATPVDRQRAGDRGADPPPERLHPERLDPEARSSICRAVGARTIPRPTPARGTVARSSSRSCTRRPSRRRRCTPPSA